MRGQVCNFEIRDEGPLELEMRGRMKDEGQIVQCLEFGGCPSRLKHPPLAGPDVFRALKLSFGGQEFKIRGLVVGFGVWGSELGGWLVVGLRVWSSELGGWGLDIRVSGVGCKVLCELPPPPRLLPPRRT